MKAIAKHRSHSIEFKRQVAQAFISGETLHALSSRHDVSRNLIRIWVRKLEAGAFDDDAKAGDLLREYEAKIAALERMVSRQALEIEFLKGTLKSAPRPRSASTSIITCPTGSPLPKDGRLMGLSRSTYYDKPSLAADNCEQLSAACEWNAARCPVLSRALRQP
jgi:transposase